MEWDGMGVMVVKMVFNSEYGTLFSRFCLGLFDVGFEDVLEPLVPYGQDTTLFRYSLRAEQPPSARETTM